MGGLIDLGGYGSSIGTIIGYFFGGPLGAIAGVFLGGLIDSHEEDGPDPLEDMQIMGVEEGDPVWRAIGKEVRVPGQVIWRGPLIPKSSESVGYRYKLSLAISAGTAFNADRTLEIKGILFNGETYWRKYSTVEATGTDISATAIGGTFFFKGVKLASSSTDLSEFQVGATVTVSGFTDGSLNGDWIVTSADDNALYLSAAGSSGATEAAGNSVTIFQTPGIWSKLYATGYWIYNGTPVRGDPDHYYSQIGQTSGIAWVESFVGAGNFPGNPGHGLLIFHDFALSAWGQSMPTVEFLVGDRDDTLLSDVVSDAVQSFGLAQCDVDATDANGTFLGMAINGPREPIRILNNIATAYNLLSQERSGVLAIFNRSAASTVTLDPDDLGAAAFGSETQSPLELQTRGRKKLPSTVHVSYLDQARNYDKGDQHQSRYDLPEVVTKRVTVPIVLSGEFARAAARRILFNEEAAASGVTIRLPPSYITVREGDILAVTAEGRDWTLLAHSVRIGSNFEVEVEAYTENPHLHVDATTLTTAPGGVPGQGGFFPPRLFAEELPALTTAQATTPAITYAASPAGAGINWSLTGLWESLDNVTYTSEAEIPTSTTIGFATDALATGTEIGFDYGSSVTVDVTGPPLLSSTDDAVARRKANIAVLWGTDGPEVFGFVTATNNGDGTYTLSRLTRGLYGTVAAMTNHAAGDTFVLLDSAAIGSLVKDADADQGATFYYKADALELDDPSSDASAVTVTFDAFSIQPSPPVLLYVEDDTPSAGDKRLHLTPTTRDPGWNPAGTATWDDLITQARYEAYIYNAGGTLLRTITGDASEQYVDYTAAQQATDTGETQWRVAQLDDDDVAGRKSVFASL
jgi:hypothetical protein